MFKKKTFFFYLYLQVAFDELGCFHSSFHIEADVYFHLRFMVSELDDWHLRSKVKPIFIFSLFTETFSTGTLKLITRAVKNQEIIVQ